MCIRDSLTGRAANKWLNTLRVAPRGGSARKAPSAEQERFLQQVINRAFREMQDEQRTGEFRSEPVQLSTTLSSGAGNRKPCSGFGPSLRTCGFTHGRELVFLASQNTMAQLIGGLTLHSYGDITFFGADHTKKNAKKAKQPRT